jgi:hypothetical protein
MRRRLVLSLWCAYVSTSLAALLLAPGCTMTPRQYWESLRGEGFPEWSDKTAAGVRGNTQSAKPSGFFTDKRSDQIEQDLGGGF